MLLWPQAADQVSFDLVRYGFGGMMASVAFSMVKRLYMKVSTYAARNEAVHK